MPENSVQATNNPQPFTANDINGIATRLEIKHAPGRFEALAIAQGIHCNRFPDAQLADAVESTQAEYLLVACWPSLLSDHLRAAVNDRAYNLHPSLLPAYAGRDPIAEQINADETRLGVTLHQLDQQFDQGPIIRQAEFQIKNRCINQHALTAQIELISAELGTALFIDYLLDSNQ